MYISKQCKRNVGKKTERVHAPYTEIHSCFATQSYSLIIIIIKRQNIKKFLRRYDFPFLLFILIFQSKRVVQIVHFTLKICFSRGKYIVSILPITPHKFMPVCLVYSSCTQQSLSFLIKVRCIVPIQIHESRGIQIRRNQKIRTFSNLYLQFKIPLKKVPWLNIFACI